MNQKTERFEMRLDPALMKQLDEYRAKEDDLPSRAEAVRRLLSRALSADMKEVRPTPVERLMLWMQAETLKQVCRVSGEPHEGETADLVLDTLYGGHFWALNWELSGLLNEHIDDYEKVRFVSDVLDMWQFIERGYMVLSEGEKEHLEEKAGVWGKDPKFSGFDGNHEGEYLSIASFLIKKLGRFQALKDREMNSHYPAVEDYRRMVQAFEEMRPTLIGRELSVGELIVLLNREGDVS